MDGNSVYLAIKNASSQDVELLNQSTQMLKSWETEPGFYSILAQICCKIDLDMDIRLMSVLYLKNCVDRYWRIATPQSIQESEKQLIRNELLKQINHIELEDRIGSIASLVIAKIGRLDWPKYWPDLIPELYKQQAWRTLHQVVKCLASKRLGPSRRVFQQMTTELLPTLQMQWEQQLHDNLTLNHEILCQNDLSNIDKLTNYLKHTQDLTFLTKIVQCLVTEGVCSDEKDENKLNQVTQIIEKSLSTASQLLLKRANSSALNHCSEQYLVCRKKLIKTFFKCVAEFLSKHSKFIKSFMKQIFISSIHLLIECSSNEERIIRQQIVLLINKILFSSDFYHYKHENHHNNSDSADILSARAADGQNLLESLLIRLIYGEFQLDLSGESALQVATNSTFMHEVLDEEVRQQAAGAEVKMSERSLEQLVGSCLKGMVNLWSNFVLSKLVAILQKLLSEGDVNQQESAVRLTICLLKDLNNNADQLEGTFISLDNLVASLASQYLSQPMSSLGLTSIQSCATILVQLRVLSLLYEWISTTFHQVPITERDRVQSPRVVFCFNVLSSIVAWPASPTSLIVRLHACQIFSQVLDDVCTVKLNSALDFDKLSALMKNILSLMKECADGEMQLKLLKTLKHFVLLSDDNNFPLYTSLFEVMPDLWNIGKAEALFQNLILDYLITITRHITTPNYLHSLVPLVVRFLLDALNEEQDETVRDCLTENCFLLTQNLLNSLPNYPPEMNDVIPLLASALLQCPEYVMEFVLASEAFLYHGVDMPGCLLFYDSLISPIIPPLIKAIPPLGSSHTNYQYLSSASTVSPSKVRRTIFDLLEDFLITCPTSCVANANFSAVVNSCANYLIRIAPVEPDQDREPLFTHIQLMVLARILFTDSARVSQAVSDLSLSSGGDSDENCFFLGVEHLVHLWLARLDHQATLLHRKLCALAPLQLLTLCNQLVEKHFDSVINACLQIIQEEEDLRKASSDSKSPIVHPDGPENLTISSENDQPGQIRGKLAKLRDVCRTRPLLDVTKSALQCIERNIGAESMSVVVEDLDPVIRKHLVTILSTQ